MSGGGGGYQYSTIDGGGAGGHYDHYPSAAAAGTYENGGVPTGVPTGVPYGRTDSAITDGDASAGSSSSGSGGSGSGSGSSGGSGSADDSFDDPRIADLPRILLMGPRRGGKSSIQRVVFHKMSPHETLFRLEATQNLERFVVDHTPLCRFTIWDFPGDYYGSVPQHHHQQQQLQLQHQGHGGGQEYYGGGSPDAMMTDPYQAEYARQQGAALVGSPLQRQPHVGGGDGNGGGGLTPQQQQQQQPTEETGAAGGGGGTASGEGGIDDDDAYVFGRATALIFVIDAQDEPYDHVLQNFTETVTRAIRANPHIAIEVFINKVDGELFLSDEAKYDCRRDVMQQVSDELVDAGVPPDSVPISYHLTSIYDHSVFEAFSRVVQKLIPQLPTLENLLNVLVSTCSMEKAYLFDVASKLYISTDSSPVDMQSVELCSDMIDVVLDVSGIYGLRGKDDTAIEAGGSAGGGGEGASLATPAGTAALTATTADLDSLATDPIPSDGTTGHNQQGEDGETSNAMGEQQSYITGDSAAADGSKDNMVGETNDELVGTLISQSIGVGDEDEEENEEKHKQQDSDSAYDNESASVIRLSNGMVLYLKEVDTMLALVCLTRADNFRKKSLINYNISCLKNALRALVQPTGDALASTDAKEM
eukprot:CAMPEP_0178501682 /NCGR_PEP_ID=MMETSP0696-20121128/17088_1 /TAXON_ID=265572 /ORGANISM="Extubocellulus spinifer, Strain CCMP396" /LENGTH=646 /DNA_ID=CAMNT_0020130663 /DNA_START=115 /DNA_END=2055 /DNA_ORIENTATION=-